MPKKHCQSKKVRKRKGKDIDEISEDQKPAKAARLALERVADPDADLPGDGQFFCTPCDRHFTDDLTRRTHLKTKVHKRRIKLLKDKPYSQKEAEAAAGVGVYDHETMGSKETDALRVKDSDAVMADIV